MQFFSLDKLFCLFVCVAAFLTGCQPNQPSELARVCKAGRDHVAFTLYSDPDQLYREFSGSHLTDKKQVDKVPMYVGQKKSGDFVVFVYAKHNEYVEAHLDPYLHYCHSHGGLWRI